MAHPNNPQAMSVQKGEAWKPSRHLWPEPPYPEVSFAHVRVVHEHDRAIAQLGNPRLEVLSNSLVGVNAIDVKEIHASVWEIRPRLGGRRPDESGESAEMVIVK